MNAIVVEQTGGPEVLQFRQAQSRGLEAGQVRAQVAYASVNFLDVYHRRGLYPMPIPGTPGMEGSGTVIEVGPGVPELKIGDRVVWLDLQVGSYAEELVIAADRVLPLPDGLTLREGAALPLQGITAQYLSHEYASITPGSTVLIHAAAGGVGLLLVQWAKHLGATVIGTVWTEEKEQLAKQAGADHMIRYTEQNFVPAVQELTNGKGVDYVIDGVGKDTFSRSQEVIRVHGWAVIYGFASGQPEGLTKSAFERALRIGIGELFTYVRAREEYTERFRQVVQGVQEGWLRIHYGPESSLAEAGTAHR